MKLDTKSTTKIDHLVIAVTNNASSNVTHILSAITVHEGDVIYEIDGTIVRHRGWPLHVFWTSVGKGNINEALNIHASKWLPSIAKSVKMKQ